LQSRDPKAKILSFFAIIILCVTLPPGKYQALTAYAVIALFLLAVSNIPITYFTRRILAILPFIGFFIVTIPFLWANGNMQMLNLYLTVISKALISITIVTILTSTTGFEKLLEGFEELKFPKLLLILLGFTYRYQYVIADEVERMKRARDSRLWGGTLLWHSRVLGQMAGMLFLRSYERSERIFMAMTSRGFEGVRLIKHKFHLDISDVVFMLAIVAISVFVRISA
jgi:cobalt/nickel transport system permease protein